MRTLYRSLALLASVAVAGPAFAQTVKTIVNQGPSSELYDMVILGDGYTAAQQAQFDADALAVANYFKNEASLFPYPQYFNVYNVHTVFRASAQSGASKPPLNIFVNNAYGSSYWTGGTERCLYITNTALASADAALAPDTDGRVMVIVNDAKYGGCAGSFSVSYNGTDMRNVQAHEWGHSLGGLADEYDYGNTGTYTGPEPTTPNITKSSTGAGKWPLWLGFSGPNGTVGAYLGAGYWPAGLYRPEPDCEMRTLYKPFCTICREQFIKSWNQQVVMIGQPTPASPTTAPQFTNKVFSFTNRLASRPNTIEWKVDAGAYAPGTTTFNWAVGAASVGPHTVTVRLTDTSTEVRNDPTALLVHTFVWTVNVTANSSALAQDVSEVLPSSLTTTEGNSASSYPWASGNVSAMRVMYSYGRSTLQAPGAVRVVGIAFRPDGNTASFPATTYDFRMDVSTSRNPARTLNTTFDANHGADRTKVYDGQLALTAKTLSGAPSQFVVQVPFEQPFDWNPALGALLVDIRYRGFTGTAVTSTFDGAFNTNEDLGRISHLSDPNAAVANAGNQNFALTAKLILDVDVAPSTLASTEASSGNSFPWGQPNGAQMRIMHVYDGTTFATNFRERQLISRLTFRPDNGAALLARTYDAKITMSTGAVGLSSAISTTYATNHGADAKVVFDGTFTSTATASGPAPKSMDLQVELQKPFSYDPNQGSLVVDVQLRGVSGNTTTSFMDATNAAVVPGIGRLFNSTNANATTGTVDTIAIVMGVCATPTPVLPEAYDSVDAPSSNSIPWSYPGATGLRALYAYAGANLGVSAPTYISHLRWRLSSGNNDAGPYNQDCSIDLSTGITAANALSTTFDNNHGADKARVFDGPMTATYQVTTGSPGAFILEARLATPFLWNPANGPLVVDIRRRNPFSQTTKFWDALSAPQTNVGRIVHTTDPNGAVANFPPDGSALVLGLGGTTNNAQTTFYGTACAGTAGTPIISSVGLPNIPNPDFQLALYKARASTSTVVIIGLARANIPLNGIGAIGCSLLDTADVASIGLPTTAGGQAFLPLPIANSPVLSGVKLPMQWAIIDPGANAANLITTGGMELVLAY